MDVHLSKKLWAANQMKTKGSNKPHQTRNTNILKLIKTARPLTAFNQPTTNILTLMPIGKPLLKDQ